MNQITTTTSVLSLLDDDLLLEIFVRLPYPSTLLRCAFTNKRHLRLISDSTFLRRFRNLQPNPPPLLGCFSNCHDRFIPAPHLDPDLAAISRGLQSSPFFSPQEQRYLNWNVIDCKDGYLLLQYLEEESIVVTHPLASWIWVQLPRPFNPDAGKHSQFYLLDCKDDGDKNSLSFQVICTYLAGYVAIFSSCTGEWQYLSLPKEICTGMGQRVNEKLYFPRKRDRYEEYMVMLDGTGLIESLAATLPLEVTETLFTIGETKDGVLCIGQIKYQILRLWLHNDDDETWTLHEEVSLYETFPMSCFIDAIISGSVLFSKWRRPSPMSCFILDLNTMKIEKMFEIDEEVSWFSYTIPWPPTFPGRKSIT